MKIFTPALRIAAAVVALNMGAYGQTIIKVDSSQPAVGPYDIVNVNPNYSTGTNGSRDYTNNHSGSGNLPVAGETFTTGSDSSGYDLTAITLQDSGSAGNGPFSSTVMYGLGVYSISGTTLTYIGGATDFTFNNVALSGGTFFTLDLPSSITLAANTEYAFTFNVEDGDPDGDYMGLGGDGDVAAGSGGSAIQVTLNDSTDLLPSSGGTLTTIDDYDRNFQISLTEAVPEPGTWAMLACGLVFLLVWQRRRRCLG